MDPQTPAFLRHPHLAAAWRLALVCLAGAAIFSIVCGAAAMQKPGDAQVPKAAASPKPFLGTWIASFQGKPFLTLCFARKAGKLAGTLSKGQITFNPDGEIASVSVTPGTDAVAIEKVEPEALYFRRNTNSSLRFALRLRDQSHADLDFLDVPPDSIQPKPIPLVKQATKH